MQKMSESDALSFLAQGSRTGKLAVAREDGRPHVTPIWFVLDGRQVVFSTWHDTVKAASIRRDGRVAMVVDDEAPPFSYVLVEGTVELSDDLEALRHWATRLGGRYMGEDKAEEFGSRNAVEGELLARLAPTRIFGLARIAD